MDVGSTCWVFSIGQEFLAREAKAAFLAHPELGAWSSQSKSL